MSRCSEPGYRILAARILRKQVKQLAQHLEGIRLGEDIEAVHRARVASRRLLAALGIFRACWKRKQLAPWKKQIRRLAQNLGEARDCDVLIEFLISSLASISDRALAPGVASLLSHVERRRQWIQPRVTRAIDRFERSGVLKSLRSSVRRTLTKLKGVVYVAGKHAHGHAAKRLHKGLGRLLEESSGLADPGQHDRHHAMRIATKRLRYTMELAGPMYAGNLAEASEAVKRLQALLGEIHDCDVWGMNIDEFAREEAGAIQLYFGGPQRFERFRPGLDYLRAERAEHRQRVFEQLAVFWRKLKDLEVWERLEHILESATAQSSLQVPALAEVARRA